VESLVRHATPKADINYRPYIAAMECWFRSPWIKELDEAGIPLPLAERLAPYVGDVQDRMEAIEAIRSLDTDEIKELDSIDKFILNFALIE